MRLVLGNRNDRLIKGPVGVVVVGAALAFSSACSSNAAQGSAAGGSLQLVPASGSTSSTPTWRTTAACPNGFQGSATFKEVHADGTSTNFISPIVNGTASPFSGTLQASIAQIRTVGAIPDGGTQKLFVTCFSQPSGLGKAGTEMTIYITYSASGDTYSTSSTH